MLMSERLGAALQVPRDCTRTGEGLGARTGPHHGTPGACPRHGAHGRTAATVPRGVPARGWRLRRLGRGSRVPSRVGDMASSSQPGCIPGRFLLLSSSASSALLLPRFARGHARRSCRLPLRAGLGPPIPATPPGLCLGGFSRAESREREATALGALDPDLHLVVKETQSGPGRAARGLSDAGHPPVQEVLGGTAHGGDGEGDGDRLAAILPGSRRKEHAEQDRGQIVAACHQRVSIRIWKLPSVPHKQFHPNI